MHCVIENFKEIVQTVYGPFSSYSKALDFIDSQKKDEEKKRLYNYKVHTIWKIEE